MKKKVPATPADSQSASFPRKTVRGGKKETKLTVDGFTRVSVAELAPVVQRLFGVAAQGTADRETYRAHLHKKYSGK
jgi:anionic cell wall polymer biosynthesis LytR-Cps2A-Psr (LCP) family protein